MSHISAREIGSQALATQKLPAGYFYLNSCRGYPISRFPLLPNLQMTVLTIFEILYRAKQIGEIMNAEKCTTLVACSGDLPDLPAAALICKWTKRTFIPYFFDDYIYQWVGVNRKISRFFEPFIVRTAKRVLVPNEFMQDEYRRRYGVEAFIIRNPSELSVQEPKQGALPLLSPVKIVYSGAIYNAHYGAFRNLVQAIQSLKDYSLELHLYTGVKKADLEREKILGPRVHFHGHIPHHEVMSALAKADVLFLPLDFDSPIQEVLRTASPGKMGELLASGKPILVHAPQNSFLSWYFRKHQCGMVVDRNNVNLLADGIAQLIINDDLRRSLGKKAFARAKEDFDLSLVRQHFFDALGLS